MSFIARGYVAHHVLSEVVQPAVSIAGTAPVPASAITTVTTETPHYFATGDTVRIEGRLATTPPGVVDGSYVITRVSATAFSVPVQSTEAGGSGGTATRTSPPKEPLTIEEGKQRAGLDWVAGDDRDKLMAQFIAAARQKVELDTGVSLLYQVRDIYYDVLTDPWVILPNGAPPLVEVLSVNAINSAGINQVMPAEHYIVDKRGARIGLVAGAVWPTDLRTFQPMRIQILSGWPDPAQIPPLLLHAVGLLTAHYATAGRDLATVGTIVSTTPFGYDDAITPFIQVVLA
jgi:uncharacterized phiE125 gp8 family phage protein